MARIKIKIRRGFTLIELLVVVSLIGILSTLVISNLNAARERGRDAQRKADLRNLQTALRLYYNDYGTFPASSTDGEIDGCGAGGDTTCTWDSAWTAGTNTYMSTLPGDPTPGQAYSYVVSGDLESYTLTACLENKSDDKGETTADPACPSAWSYSVSP